MQVKHLGICNYQDTLSKMQEFTQNRTSDDADQFWLLQHHPVYTQGVAGKAENIINSHTIPIVQSDRGGQITYHGPGQLTGYLLVDLKRHQLNARQFVSTIEQCLIAILSHWGIATKARADAPGVYIDSENLSVHGAKIGALGLRIKRGCSYHGFNLNIDMDMVPWLGINPCGLSTPVTQMSDLLNDATPSIEEVSRYAETVFDNKLA